jgi:lysophospholipase L1-like esterase
MRAMPTRILILGDSFVVGVGATQAGWAEQVAGRCRSWAEVTVSGGNGDTSAELLTRAPGLATERFTAVFIQIGLNDSRYRPSKKAQEVPLDTFTANLRELCEIFQQTGSWVWLIGLGGVDEAGTDPWKEDEHYRNDLVSTYDRALERVASQTGAGFLACPALWRDHLLADGLHPSQAGHDAIAARVLATLEATRHSAASGTFPG